MAHTTVNTAGIISLTFAVEDSSSVNPPYYNTLLLPSVVKLQSSDIVSFEFNERDSMNFTGFYNTFPKSVGVTEVFNNKKVYVVGKFEGNVTENQFPVSRLVRLYLSSTGEYVGETTSAVDGSYKIETPFTGEHFVVAFDDDAGEEYNALIQDKLLPQAIG